MSLRERRLRVIGSVPMSRNSWMRLVTRLLTSNLSRTCLCLSVAWLVRGLLLRPAARGAICCVCAMWPQRKHGAFGARASPQLHAGADETPAVTRSR